MKDIRDDISYKLAFDFDVAKNNDMRRKDDLQKRLKEYNIKKIKNIFYINSDDLDLKIDKDMVFIETSKEEKLFRVLSVIGEVYNYNLEKLGERDYLGLQYKFKDDKINVNNFEKFINEVVKISNKDEYTILLEVNIIKILEDESAIECNYELVGDSINFSVSPINNKSRLKDAIEFLVDYMRKQVEYFKRNLDDGE